MDARFRAEQASIIDANRPTLSTLIAGWGHQAIDGGLCQDNPKEIQEAMDRASQNADALLISGGASAGDEDHVSQLLKREARILAWRIAVKPGRPLVLARWNDMLVFGLPGNPVAAFVCALVFARPALGVLAGEDWQEPVGFDVPAGFEKTKQAGRREFIRARIDNQGRAAAFRSEGSGLTTGLAWADGLVELGDGARRIEFGSPVRRPAP